MEERPVASETPTPQSTITEYHVMKALIADKGVDVHLISWKVVDFTKPGDNYACIVTSVTVTYSNNNLKSNVSYIVKLNAQRKVEGFPDVTNLIFQKEGKFYQELLPELNVQLVSAGQTPLRFAKCFHVNLEEEKEQIYFEDLRAHGFKMFERRMGMPKDHATLVLQELARLHSASYLLMEKSPEPPVGVRFDFLLRDFLNFTENFDELKPLLQGCLSRGISMLEKIGGYETAITYLEGMKSELVEILGAGMQSKRFNSICHGDCWTNNILFRYDDEGVHPVEVRLVDLQVCRKASLATDLNYFLYTSLTGDVRRPNLEELLGTYHSTYKTVLEGGHLPMYFNTEELLEEFRDKNKMGLFFSMMVVPVMLLEPSDVPDMTTGDAQELIEDFTQTSLANIDSNPLLKPRFLAVFDELMETGLIT